LIILGCAVFYARHVRRSLRGQRVRWDRGTALRDWPMHLTQPSKAERGQSGWSPHAFRQAARADV